MNSVVETMIMHFGGKLALTMIGATNVVHGNTTRLNDTIDTNVEDSDYIVIKFKAKAKKVNGKSPNVFHMVYDSSNDLYEMHFSRLHGLKHTKLKKYDQVFAEDVMRIFTETTGLYLSL